ncbi:hypothetical protein BTW15_01690 [Pseudomonas syringae pv. tomato]|uniref:Uncharacterized protein n=2 Tax=Pseudomonas syringae group genomosp. 3 TaxID=251701 RepID=A0AB36L597_PSEUB|nr:hypothetical protein XJ28_10805 [Pseudomonas syringae pv. tomato]EEB59964.1 hypothetical protein PSPTOT1_0063 [Pseudomonas syringae pv. tomato T1]KKI24856.1 hypothetical protein WX98_17670 [Pseudomonas syringae pv. persicae]KTB96803.1 hypothetical protein AO386_07305 [Pseudomonas syringae ICMP 11292]POD63686.1 hypothetical protein BKM07_23545 [Pseudomonas syringae group genomosp. 3]PYD03723.1 hypothetical protein DND90_03375 [Pseudomonas syringae pv. maculicola]
MTAIMSESESDRGLSAARPLISWPDAELLYPINCPWSSMVSSEPGFVRKVAALGGAALKTGSSASPIGMLIYNP